MEEKVCDIHQHVPKSVQIGIMGLNDQLIKLTKLN